LADRSEVDRWEKINRWCRVAFFASLAPLVVVALILGGQLEGAQNWLLVLPIMTLVVGIYCTFKHYGAFIDYEMSRGVSKEAAKEKWNILYPTSADG
jgi:hypothetical protein